MNPISTVKVTFEDETFTFVRAASLGEGARLATQLFPDAGVIASRSFVHPNVAKGLGGLRNQLLEECDRGETWRVVGFAARS